MVHLYRQLRQCLFSINYCQLKHFASISNADLLRVIAKARKDDQQLNETQTTFKKRPMGQTMGRNRVKGPLLSRSEFREKAAGLSDLDGLKLYLKNYLPDKLTPQSVNFSQNSNILEEFGLVVDEHGLHCALFDFIKNPSILQLLFDELEIDDKLLIVTYQEFYKTCSVKNLPNLPPELQILLADLSVGSGNMPDLVPHFIDFAKRTFPHVGRWSELATALNMTSPVQIYSLLRKCKRKIIFHAGPTNSGKTYYALKALAAAENGIYLGPLRLLAWEVVQKLNSSGVPCDLITGELRTYAKSEDMPSPHAACTVEMVPLKDVFDVAVIDEIQMMSDDERGWAFTRALLGVSAKTLHVCGEVRMLPIVEHLCVECGDEFEHHIYKRKTPLVFSGKTVNTIENIKPGDAIVVFDKTSVKEYARKVAEKGLQVAMIYGKMPPVEKLRQAAKFNSPNSRSVLVSTDAIGMGVNLNISRVVFASVTKMGRLITKSEALQIAGRAGRFGLQEKGIVTTFRSHHCATLFSILKSPTVTPKVGLLPSLEQLELISYYFPSLKPWQLYNIWFDTVIIDETRYFICNNNIHSKIELIKHLDLSLVDLHKLTNCPLSLGRRLCQKTLLCYSIVIGERRVLELAELLSLLEIPALDEDYEQFCTTRELEHLEDIHGCLSAYRWLSYRYSKSFPHRKNVSFIMHRVTKMISAATSYCMNNEDSIQEHKVRKRRILSPADVGVAEETVSADGDSPLTEEQKLLSITEEPIEEPIETAILDTDESENVMYEDT